MSQIASPCVNICKMQDDVCQGCFRSIEEISNWTSYTDQEKRLTLNLIKIRKKQKEYLMGEDWINEPTFLDNATVSEVFVWWPKKCRYTDKMLWLTPAMRARIVYFPQDGKVYYEDRYYDSEEFILRTLKNGY